jgi:FKBP-type peptidyl-prolyl cis-trans isomerase 2
MVSDLITPGMWVRHRDRSDWGIGQVQSVIGDRVTVNFQHAGKVLINSAIVMLDEVTESQRHELAQGAEDGTGTCSRAGSATKS